MLLVDIMVSAMIRVDNVHCPSVDPSLTMGISAFVPRFGKRVSMSRWNRDLELKFADIGSSPSVKCEER